MLKCLNGSSKRISFKMIKRKINLKYIFLKKLSLIHFNKHFDHLLSCLYSY
jgi:hypothetical protein